MTSFECGPINYTTETGLKVLRGIHMKLDAPALVVINGPSGCGKSTLLRAIVGLNRASVTARRLDGENFSENSLPFWRARVTLLLQDAPCLEGTLLRNLSFPFESKTASHRIFSEQAAMKIIREVKLEHIPLDDDVSRLSGGERHRLGLVRGILWAPPILIADEPLSGLEPELADICFELLKSYSRQKNAIVICVLHQERFAEKADQWLRLEDGTLHTVNPV